MLNTPDGPIGTPYCEGKAKRTPVRGVKENLKPQTDKMSRLARVVACLL